MTTQMRLSAYRRLLRAAVIALACVLPLTGTLCAQPLRPVPTVKPEILRVIKHDPVAFTQGLILIDSMLYESSGLVGKSALRRIDPATGGVVTDIPLDADLFAEGITVFGGELVQLTWKHGFALRYEFPSLKAKPAVSSYRYQGEGWGLTNDGRSFIMSNGSDTLYFRDGKFGIARKLPVTLRGRPLRHLNELQYLRGHVYANIWYENFIAEISAGHGAVTRIIDCAELVNIENPPKDNVLNGIAYCERKNEWYLTGKNWRNMFVVRIPE